MYSYRTQGRGEHNGNEGLSDHSEGGKSCGGQAMEYMMAEEDEDSSGACVTNYYFPKKSNLGEFLNHLRCGGESSDVINLQGTIIAECERDWDDIVMYMDPEIAEELNSNLAPCSNQEFFDAYCEVHDKSLEKLLSGTPIH